MKTRVLDSWPILEWIEGRHPAVAIVDALLADATRGSACLLMSAINVGEVYYFLCKHRAAALAALWRETSSTLPVTIEVPNGDDIWSAAELKANYPISYADAFAGALAQKHRCPLLTGDPEFRTVQGLQLDWLDRA